MRLYFALLFIAFLAPFCAHAQIVDEPTVDPSYIFQTPTTPALPSTVSSVTPDASDIILLWEANTYVPPFYKGKRLYTVGSHVTITALPNIVVGGRRLGTQELVFSWEKDGTTFHSRSGLGQNSITVTGGFISRTMTVSLTISSSGGSPLGFTQITIPLSEPHVSLYEDNPSFGTRFSHALTTTHELGDEEMTVAAYPYFFSTQNRRSLSYDWNIAGEEETDPTVTLRNTGITGATNISVFVKNSLVPGQNAKAATTITY